jgi:uncharacterized protein YggE
MKHNLTALAVSLLAGALLLNAQAASAQTNPPPATTTQTTGEVSRDPTVKKMNEDEKAKVETKGK